MPERVLPREFPTPPEYVIPLSNAELQELGTFTAIWSQLDFIIMMMYCLIAKVETGVAVVTMENMTTGPRINLVTKLCGVDPANETKKAIKKIFDDNGGLVEDHNQVIHGLWAIEWNHSTGKTKPASMYQKGARKPIPATKLAELSNRAAALCNKLGEQLRKLSPALDFGERPARFFFGAGSPQGHAPPTWPPAQES